MLIFPHSVLSRAAYETFGCDARIELYQATTTWFYVVEAMFPDYADHEALKIVHRRIVPGHHTTVVDGIAAVKAHVVQLENRSAALNHYLMESAQHMAGLEAMTEDMSNDMAEWSDFDTYGSFEDAF